MENKNEAIIEDAYHTMDELYDHRTILFANLIKALRHRYFYKNGECIAINTWKSRKHSDGTYEDGWFIAGIDTPFGQVTYHQKEEFWDLFKCTELEQAPEYDGHTPDDVLKRLTLLLD